MSVPKKKLGFGMMRLPQMNSNGIAVIDYETVNKMVDVFMERGFNYFDTAFMYGGGFSEVAIGKCLSARYPRDSFFLTDKMSVHMLQTPDQQVPKFKEQLQKCGVDYFDNYLVHNMSVNNYSKAKEWKTFEWVQSLKENGLVRHTGFSFHDTPELLEEILTDHPEVDFVQLQLNYNDWNNKAIQSGKCYDVAVKRGKKVIVMEPLKGGTLADVPEDVKKLYKSCHPDLSAASWGIRFAASQENVMMVLSGMSTIDQVLDNTGYMQDFKPFTHEEFEIVNKALDMINASIAIPCTGCGYCTEVCPKNIAIPQYFSLYNAHKQVSGGFTSHAVYYKNYNRNFGKASACSRCSRCEGECPQHLEITKYLKDVAKTFEH